MANTLKSKEKPRRIKYKYIYKEDYNAKYVTGLYGGVIQTGDIVVNFFCERHALPISQTHAISEEQILGEIIENEPTDLTQSMVRMVENGIILNIVTAKKITAWLNEQISAAEKVIKTQTEAKK